MAVSERFILRGVLLGVVPIAAALALGYVYVSGGRYVSTENAYVKADIVAISPEIDGRVIEVAARGNQAVAAGDLLFVIDPEPFDIALDIEEAELAAVRQRIDALRAQYREGEAELRAAEERIRFVTLEYERQTQLRTKGIGTLAKYQQAEHDLAMAKRQIAVLRERNRTILAELGGDPDTPVELHPMYMQAKARRDRAALDLARTQVVAPTAGVLSRVDLEAGEHVEAGDPVFALVASGDVWVEANLKEVHLTHVTEGQAATVVIDAYPGIEWPATVDSISPATGAEFALLPPQNATGNWVKVVQRVPVRLRLEPRADAPPLRAGMTATVSIDTGVERKIGMLVGGVLARTLKQQE